MKIHFDVHMDYDDDGAVYYSLINNDWDLLPSDTDSLYSFNEDHQLTIL